MPIYTISGIEVNFPYEAYECQIDYMKSVIDALNNRQNALLESPTGTGKTLCLLCASLAWRESQVPQAAAELTKIKEEGEKAELKAANGLKEVGATHKLEKLQKGGLPPIIYSSRTHSQLQQVMKELKTTGYKPRTAVLASRQQGGCLNPQVSFLGGTAANQLCRKLVSKGGCKWHYGVEKFTQSHPDVNQDVLDIEDLANLGTSRQLCPYYLGRSFASSADLIFMPYNYLMDHKFRLGLNINWEGSVLIFDEAHNVEGVCSDALSFDLPLTVIASSVQEAQEAAVIARKLIEKESEHVVFFAKASGSRDLPMLRQLATNLDILKAILLKFAMELENINIPGEKGFTAPGKGLFEFFEKIGLTEETWALLNMAISEAVDLLTGDAAADGRVFAARNSQYRLTTLKECLQMAFDSLMLLNGNTNNDTDTHGGGATTTTRPSTSKAVTAYKEEQLEATSARHLGYRMHVHLEKNPRNGNRMEPTLSYWCFSPGQSMQALAETKIRSILLTSGTLAPLDSFAAELSLPFEVQLENPHVIDPSQVWLGVVPVGPAGCKLNSSFQTRDSDAYKSDLGNAILNFARIVPDGLLVFFPSYAVLKSCIDHWKSHGGHGGSIWSQIESLKAPVIEPREASLFPQAALDFRTKLDSPQYRGAVFFAVCRGKVSEGLDFSDRAGRAVVITGIPYAMKGDPKVRIKQEVLNEALRTRHKRPHIKTNGPPPPPPPAGLSGDQWYVQQATRAVNQAMGRVIRHRRDFGAILLCDERFRQENVRSQLSKWLRDKVKVYDGFTGATESLKSFFRQQSALSEVYRREEFEAAALKQQLQQIQQQKTMGTFGQVIAGGGGSGSNNSMRGQRQQMMRHIPAAMDVAGMAEMIGYNYNTTTTNTNNGSTNINGSNGKQQQQQQGTNSGKNGLLGILENSTGGFSGAGQGSKRLQQHTSSIDALCGSGGRARPAIEIQTEQHPTTTSGGGLRDGGGGGGSLKPWERASIAPTMKPNAPRVGGLLDSIGNNSSGFRGGGGDLPAFVGPAHKIAEHQERLKQQQLQKQQQSSLRSDGADNKGDGKGEEVLQKPTNTNPLAQQQHHQQQPTTSTHSGGVGGATTTTTVAPKTDVASFMARLKQELSPDAMKTMQTTLQAYVKNRGDAERCKALVCKLIQVLLKCGKPELVEGLRGFVAKESLWPSEEQFQSMQRETQHGGSHSSWKLRLLPTARTGGSNGMAGGPTRTAPVPPTRSAFPMKPIPPQQFQELPLSRATGAPLPPLLPSANTTAPSIGGIGDVNRSIQGGGMQVGPRKPVGKTPPCPVCKTTAMEGPQESSCCGRIACYGCWKKDLAAMKCPQCKKQLRAKMLRPKYFV